MVTPAEAVAAVVDPELRVLTLVDLGIVRDVSTRDGQVTVTITPTYSGCPAMELIRTDIARSLAAAGYPDARVRTQLAPAWSTDWISPSGRDKLAAAGIAPPGPARPVVLGLPARAAFTCPQCGAAQTEEISRFGSTPCKALWRCRSCGEPFDAVKPL